MGFTRGLAALLLLVWTAAAAGIVRAEPAVPPAGARLAGVLQGHLGAAPEWAPVAGVAEPAAALAAATAALGDWLQRRFPGADPLAAGGLPGHLARRAAAEAGLLAPRELWALVAADVAAARAGRAQRPGLQPGRPDSAASPAHYAAEARLFWYRYEWLQRPRGESLFTALGAADPAATVSLGRQLVARIPGYWFTYVEEGRPTPLTELLADQDGDGLPAGLEAELGTDPANPDSDGDSLPDGADPEPLVPAIRVLVAGRPLDLAATPPLLEDGHVLLPLRAVFTALGAEVTWDPGARRVEAHQGSRGLSLTPEKATALVWNGGQRQAVALPVPPRLIDGRIYVPLRFASEALGAAVAWEPATRTVRITPAPPAPPALAAGAADPRKVVYLTFDDGPSPELTPQVLDILASAGVPATFFLVGQNAERYPELVRRMAAAGHALGNHTWDHRWDTVYTSPAALVASLDRAGAAIGRAAGQVPPRLARVPGGRGSAWLAGKDRGAYWEAAARQGYVLFDWNVAIGDAIPGIPLDADSLLENLKQGVQQAGAGPYVVLMHDAPAHHTPTVAALPRIIAWFRDWGYTFRTLTPDVTAGR